MEKFILNLSYIIGLVLIAGIWFLTSPNQSKFDGLSSGVYEIVLIIGFILLLFYWIYFAWNLKNIQAFKVPAVFIVIFILVLSRNQISEYFEFQKHKNDPQNIYAREISSLLKSKEKEKTALVPKDVKTLFANFEYEKHQLNTDEFEKLAQQKETIILDLRPPELYKTGHLKGAINIGTDITIEKLKKLIPSNNSTLITYCSNSFEPTRMISLTNSLVPQIYALGYSKVYFLCDSYIKGCEKNSELKNKIGWVK
jgi:hypothetical protein